ncbi:MAG: zinc ribbon domain-containing protein, partial [Actinomycetota bacterium]
MSRQCQSCGMPLVTKRAGDRRGSELDGSKRNTWCLLCYTDGRFVGSDCTLTEMIEIVDRALIDNGSGRVFPLDGPSTGPAAGPLAPFLIRCTARGVARGYPASVV